MQKHIRLAIMMAVVFITFCFSIFSSYTYAHSLIKASGGCGPSGPNAICSYDIELNSTIQSFYCDIKAPSNATIIATYVDGNHYFINGQHSMPVSIEEINQGYFRPMPIQITADSNVKLQLNLMPFGSPQWDNNTFEGITLGCHPSTSGRGSPQM